MNNPAQVLDQMLADPSINGQHVDVDHEFGGQCWDEVELFAEKLGVPKDPWAIPLGPKGWASEAWTEYDNSPHMQKYFEKIPKGQEQKGDIGVYIGHGIFVEGHIAVHLGNGQVFEENADPDGSPAHVATRPDTYLLGSLRLKGGAMDVPNDDDIINMKRSETGVANYQPTGEEFRFYKDPANGWKRLAYDTRQGMQIQIQKAGGAAQDKLNQIKQIIG